MNAATTKFYCIYKKESESGKDKLVPVSAWPSRDDAEYALQRKFDDYISFNEEDMNEYKNSFVIIELPVVINACQS